MAPAAIIDTLSSPLKPSLTSTKRSLSQLSTSEEPASSQSKRQKVSFSPHVDVHMFDHFGEKSAAVIREEINIAIKQHDLGEDEKYNEVKAIFTEDPDSRDAPSNNVVQKYLLGMIENVTLLSRSCADLVHAVLQYKWLAQDDALVQLYKRFLGHLVSVHRGYLLDVLTMLLENFAHISSSAGRLPDPILTDRLTLQARVHVMLKYLLGLIPSGSIALSSSIATKFPHEDDTKKAHTEYVRNLLRITEYAPELKAEVLDLVVERLVGIDVSVQQDVEDLEEEIGDFLVPGDHLHDHHPFNHEDNDSDLSDSDSDADDDDDDDDDDDEEVEEDEDGNEKDKQDPAVRAAKVRANVQKMDAVLDNLFTFYTPSFSKNSQSATANSMFNAMLSQFQKHILSAYRSRHTQFLLFHFAQTSQAFMTSFIDKCLDLLTDKNKTDYTRASAAAYVASFVARAAKLTPDIVVYAFDRLASYLETLRKTYEPRARAGPDLAKFSTYYVTAQALVYIFCFRWRDLLASASAHDADSDSDEDEDLAGPGSIGGKELVWVAGVKEAFSANFHSRLNPLKLLAPSIVEEFASIALHTRFMYVYAIIDANKRVRIHSNPSSGATTPVRGVASGMPNRETAMNAQFVGGDARRHLEAYFPFDPYRLPRSRQWLIGDYKEWQGVDDADGEAQAEVDRDSSDELMVEEDEADDDGSEVGESSDDEE